MSSCLRALSAFHKKWNVNLWCDVTAVRAASVSDWRAEDVEIKSESLVCWMDRLLSSSFLRWFLFTLRVLGLFIFFFCFCLGLDGEETCQRKHQSVGCTEEQTPTLETHGCCWLVIFSVLHQRVESVECIPPPRPNSPFDSVKPDPVSVSGF